MSTIERYREPIAALPDRERLEAKAREGWRPVAIEWERGRRPEASGRRPIPYGLRISADCQSLEIDPVEKDVVATIVALIAADLPLSRIAGELNRRGFRDRAGSEWSQVSLFRLLPRVVELGPEILSQSEWSAQKDSVLEAVG